MFGVNVPDADALRELVPDIQRLLKWPYCAYLFFLARHVDKEAVAFLQRYARAIHDETGEAIAVIVLFDDVTVLGQAMGHGGGETDSAAQPLRRITDPRIVYGSYPLQSRELISDDDIVSEYHASPRWSLKFADSIGLSRTFLPCLVAFDADPDPQAPDCVVVDLSDADQAWSTLRDSVASFMADAPGRRFVRTAERLREVERQIPGAQYALHEAEGAMSVAGTVWERTYLVPDTPEGLLWILSQRDHPDRMDVVRMATRSSRLEPTDAALARAVADPLVLRALVHHQPRTDYLRQHWLGATYPPGGAPAAVVRRLRESLLILGREPSAAQIDDCLAADLVERSRFLEAVDRTAQADLSAITDSLRRIRNPLAPAARPQDEERQMAAAFRFYGLRSEAEALRADLTPARFLPHLAAAVGSGAPGGPTGAEKTARTTLARIASATNFSAAVVQILQGIGVLR
jgi:hypothetical protein